MLNNDIKKQQYKVNQFKSTEISFFASFKLKELKQDLEYAKTVKMKTKDDSNTISGKSVISSVIEKQKATNDCLSDICS